MHTLHTCTSALFDTLVSLHLSPEHRISTGNLLRRVITALVHHCHKAEHFSPISDILVSRFMSVASDEQAPFVTELLYIACAVRCGSRMARTFIEIVQA